MEYHRQKTASDPEYAQVVRDSRRKWRQAHSGYQKVWRQSHPEAEERKALSVGLSNAYFKSLGLPSLFEEVSA